jgi:hypothetical protein
MTVQQLVKKVAVFMKLGSNLPLAPVFTFINYDLKNPRLEWLLGRSAGGG